MTDAPERIWIDACGGKWSPVSGGTQREEYIRADLVTQRTPDPAVLALVEAARLLHDNVVTAFPSLADLGPVSNLRAALSAFDETGQ